MSLPYYKRFPRDFIEGTIGMTLELKGAYSLLLDLIYMQDGMLPDDARYISGHLGCSIRQWQKIRKALLDDAKIYVNVGLIGNYRADKERETLVKYQSNQAEKGRASNKNKDLPKAVVNPARDYPEPDTEKKEIAKAISKEKRGTRLQGDWKVSDAEIEFAVAEGMARNRAVAEADKFRDYWVSKPGQAGVKLDWQATWRNWIRNSMKNSQAPPPNQLGIVATALEMAKRFEETSR